MADAGIADIRRALALLGQIGAQGMDIRGMRSSHPDLAAYPKVAMIAGMAALRSSYFGSKQPSTEAIVEELTEAILPRVPASARLSSQPAEWRPSLSGLSGSTWRIGCHDLRVARWRPTGNARAQRDASWLTV